MAHTLCHQNGSVPKETTGFRLGIDSRHYACGMTENIQMPTGWKHVLTLHQFWLPKLGDLDLLCFPRAESFAFCSCKAAKWGAEAAEIR